MYAQPLDADDKFVADALVGGHVSQYPYIPFPADVPQRVQAAQRSIMVAVLPGFAEWKAYTLPLLRYLSSMPDPIDVFLVSPVALQVTARGPWLCCCCLA